MSATSTCLTLLILLTNPHFAIRHVCLGAFNKCDTEKMSKVRRQTEKKTAAESGASAGLAEDASAALNPTLVTLLEQHRTAIAADFKPTS